MTALRDEAQAQEAAVVAARNAVDAAVRSAAQTATAGDAAVQRRARRAGSRRSPAAGGERAGRHVGGSRRRSTPRRSSCGPPRSSCRRPKTRSAPACRPARSCSCRSLPLTVTDVAVTPGGAATGALATVSSRGHRGRRAACPPSTPTSSSRARPVVIEIRETDEQFPGTVSYVGPPRRPRRRGGEEEGGFPQRGAATTVVRSSRLQVLVTPDDPDAVNQYVDFSRAASASTWGRRTATCSSSRWPRCRWAATARARSRSSSSR